MKIMKRLPALALALVLALALAPAAGAAAVFFKKKDRAGDAEGALSAFAAGVMLAASVWSLLLPAIERAETSFLPQFLPPALGVTAGALFCLLLDRLLPGLSTRIDALPSGKKKTALLIWAVFAALSLIDVHTEAHGYIEEGILRIVRLFIGGMPA